MNRSGIKPYICNEFNSIIQNVMKLKKVKFAENKAEDFYKELRKRVSAYFKENNVSRYANFNMVFKTVFMISLYIAPFVMVLTVVNSVWLNLLMWVLMGFGMAGIGL